MSSSIQAQYEAWLACPAMPQELLEDLKGMDEAAKNDSFYRELAFGTGGLRGVLGAGTNRMNSFTVARATRGLGTYLKESYEHPSVALSCDSRIHSRDFVELTAATLAEMGIRVFLYPKLQPTPMLSFAVRHLGCSAGVMVTASHNPAKFNGYKVYGDDGCQITLEAADRITGYIQQQPMLADKLPELAPWLEKGVVTYITEETIEAYYQQILTLQVKPSKTPLHVVYSPLNGAGNVPVREIMRRMGNIQVDVVAEQENPDGHFPTCPYPNPEIREAMNLAIQKCVETGADFCFATDPDSDRMGAGVRVGNDVTLISGNEMGVLMLDYLSRNKAQKSDLPPVAVKTIVSTNMADALCEKRGIELKSVLTGFKFICEQIHFLDEKGQTDRFLFGFEESYGYLSGTFVRDKDAVNAALLLCEMAANLKAEGKTLLDRLQELREEFGYFAQKTLTFQYEGQDGANRMAQIMAELRKPLAEFADPAVQTARRVDYLIDETGLPKSDVIEFNLENGQKFIVRPSGTEPKLKAYLFSRGKDQEAAGVALAELEPQVAKLCQ
ncbi:MAG: phospho-sugar mutase [Clostridia bacterium]|nr:phospho-sugar mutase [Clostridia bacterium]